MSVDVAVTGRQAEIFAFLERFIAEKGYPPTRAEIATEFGFTSINAAEQQLRALEKKGAITIARGTSRGIALLCRSAGKDA